MSSFQTAFAQALLSPVCAIEPAVRGLMTQAAIAVYRNTLMKSCVDALQANFPTVSRLVGNEWFRSAAAAYAAGLPPTDARLFTYGDDGFADFLQRLPSAAQLPYLAGVALLDTLWREALVAPDAPVLEPAGLAHDTPHELAARVLRPHPATRWIWFDALPVATIWSRTRLAQPLDEDLEWRGDGLLLTRPQGKVSWHPLDLGGRAFLDCCRAGATLGEAADVCLAADANADLPDLLRRLLQAGAFSSSSFPPASERSP